MFTFNNRHFFTLVHFQAALLLALFTLGCIPQMFPSTPTDSVVSTVTHSNLETPTSTVSAVATGTMLPGLIEAAQIVINAIETTQPDLLRSIIGDKGVAVVGFGQGVNFKGINNSDEIVSAFADVLPQSTQICEAFAPQFGTLPDKAILVYRGIKFDWSKFGLSESSSDDSMTLQLFKLPEGWRLVYITPFNSEWVPQLGPLQECP